MGEREFSEETRDTVIEDVAVGAGGLVREGASEPGFAGTAGASEEQVVMFVDPIAAGEFMKQALVDAARG